MRFFCLLAVILFVSCSPHWFEQDLGPPIAILNPDYVVLRPVSPKSGTVSAVLDGQTYYYEPGDRLIDLSHLDPRTAEVAEGHEPGQFVVRIRTTGDGAQSLRKWTSDHIGEHLGIFVDGRLTAAPVIRSTVDHAIVIAGPWSREDAEVIFAVICRGGSA